MPHRISVLGVVVHMAVSRVVLGSHAWLCKATSLKSKLSAAESSISFCIAYRGNL